MVWGGFHGSSSKALEEILNHRAAHPFRIVAFFDDPIIARRILRHVGLDPEPRPPPLPGQLEMF